MSIVGDGNIGSKRPAIFIASSIAMAPSTGAAPITVKIRCRGGTFAPLRWHATPTRNRLSVAWVYRRSPLTHLTFYGCTPPPSWQNQQVTTVSSRPPHNPPDCGGSRARFHSAPASTPLSDHVIRSTTTAPHSRSSTTTSRSVAPGIHAQQTMPDGRPTPLMMRNPPT